MARWFLSLGSVLSASMIATPCSTAGRIGNVARRMTLWFVFCLAIILLASSVVADVIVAPPKPPCYACEALERMASERKARESEEKQRQHEAELQRRQHDHERTLARGAVAPDPVARPEYAFDMTGPVLNGRAWLTWPAELRYVFVMALYEGAASAPTFDEQLRTSALYGEIVEGVTAVFTEPESRVLPISSAVRIFVAKARGTGGVEIELMKSRMLAEIAAGPGE